MNTPSEAEIQAEGRLIATRAVLTAAVWQLSPTQRNELLADTTDVVFDSYRDRLREDVLDAAALELERVRRWLEDGGHPQTLMAID